MYRKSRDPKQLVRDLETSVRLRDIREWTNIKSALSMGFWEMFLLAGLFSFGIGVLTTLIYVIPPENEALYYFMLLWSVGFVVMVVVAFEFLIRKYRVMRRALELTFRRLEKLEKDAAPPRKKKSAGKGVKEGPGVGE